MAIIPKKLKPGDHIRVVSPSTSLAVISESQIAQATQRLERLGLTISFSQHAKELDDFSSSSVASRVADLHDAFADPTVDGILTTLGGHNANQLLPHLDYNLIRKHPKPFCGFSDITALQMAILAKANLITYSGPHFSTFGMKLGLDYTVDQFVQCVMSDDLLTVEPADHWSDDMWFSDQNNRTFHQHDGYIIVNEGVGSGQIVGGNLCTFNLTHGTEFYPHLDDHILLLEDDFESSLATFDRDLQSVLHLPDAGKITGLLIGRFQTQSNVERDLFIKMLKAKPELQHIPVVIEASFGHVTPFFTFPQGGTGRLSAQNGKVAFTIDQH